MPKAIATIAPNATKAKLKLGGKISARSRPVIMPLPSRIVTSLFLKYLIAASVPTAKPTLTAIIVNW